MILGRVEPEGVAYNEAVRALDEQRSELDSLRGRAAAIFASPASSPHILAKFVLDPKTGLDLLEWVAVGSFCGVAVSVLAVLWPWRWWRWESPRQGANSPTTWRGENRVTAAQMQRDLTIHLVGAETRPQPRAAEVAVHPADDRDRVSGARGSVLRIGRVAGRI